MIEGNMELIMDQLKQEICAITPSPRVAVKINLPSPPKPGVVRTDPELLRHTVLCLAACGCDVTIVEGAGGHLPENLSLIGLGSLLNDPGVHCLDLDMEERILWRERHGRNYPLPSVLSDMELRIAIPGTTKRPGYLFSGNIKTMVGLLPRCLCQNGVRSVYSRPMIHENLMETVSDLFLVVQETMPFHIFINGGNTISDSWGITHFPHYYIGNDPVAMDEYLAGQLYVPLPDYLTCLKSLHMR